MQFQFVAHMSQSFPPISRQLAARIWSCLVADFILFYTVKNAILRLPYVYLTLRSFRMRTKTVF